MFEQFLNPEKPTRERGIEDGVREQECSSADLQYEICSRFMRMTSEKLYQRELQLMSSTSAFMEKVADSLILKDISTTQESLTLEPFLEEEDPFAAPSKSKLLLRKCQSNSSLRRTDSGVTDALREVQKKCSEKSSGLLSNMVNQFRRMKQKLSSLQRLEKDLKKAEGNAHSVEQELLLLRKRVSDLESENKMASDELQTLRKKLKDMTDQAKTHTLSLSKSSDNLRAMGNQTGTDRLKRYLEEKEVHIYKKEKDIRNLQDRIQKSIQGVVDEGSCDKCCQLVRRIKDSVIKYRAYLEEESNVAETFYQNYKRLFA